MSTNPSSRTRPLYDPAPRTTLDAVVNITPDPMTIYSPHTPDRIVPGTVVPLTILPVHPHYRPAEVGHAAMGMAAVRFPIPVDLVAYNMDGEGVQLPDPIPGTYFLVSLVVALMAANRHDLLVPHAYVRDMDGRIVGCRRLVLPLHIYED